jgi:hypothetical protein
MHRQISKTPQERNLWFENAVLEEVVGLHPARLTTTELISRMNNNWEDSEDIAIEDSIQALRRSGLVRITEGIVEPTYAALRAHAILSV